MAPTPALPGHLFRDADGMLRDRNIEELARRLEKGDRLGAPFLAMLRRHTAMFRGAPQLPDEALTDAAVALDWAGALGVAAITRLRPEEHTAAAERIEKHGLRYVATLDVGQRSPPALGRTIPLAVMLAVVLVMREQAAAAHNPPRPPAPRSRAVH